MEVYLILNEVVIRKIPKAINIEAKIRIIISFNNRMSKPININAIPIFKRRLEPWPFIL